MTTTEPHPALAHRCPFCGVEPGHACRTHRGRGRELDWPHSRRIQALGDLGARMRAAAEQLPRPSDAVIDQQVGDKLSPAPAQDQKPPRRALCCECGQLRTFSANYHFALADENAPQSVGHFTDPRGWRATGTLKCAHCGRRTRHAVLREPDPRFRDYDERVQEYTLGGEWHDQYAPDRDRLRAEYFAQFPRNPYLTHRRYTAEAQKAWDDGTKWVTALCGAQIEVKVDPRQAAKYSKPEHRINGYLVAEQLSDIEYEDPETGLSWIDMDCVDCWRVSNRKHWEAQRKRLEYLLAWFALHPEEVPDEEVDSLSVLMERLVCLRNGLEPS